VGDSLQLIQVLRIFRYCESQLKGAESWPLRKGRQSVSLVFFPITAILDSAKQYGPFDLIFEATGASQVVFESMQAVGKNGALVLSSVTGGDKKVEVPADKINLALVLGNKLLVGTVNANREYFESCVRDMALDRQCILAG